MAKFSTLMPSPNYHLNYVADERKPGPGNSFKIVLAEEEPAYEGAFERMAELKKMLDSRLISDEEYETKRLEILSTI
jgi:hypothetical protein